MKSSVMVLLLAAAASSASFAAEIKKAPAAERPVAVSADDASVKWGPAPAFFPAGSQVAVLRGDPAGGESDAFLRVPSGAVIPAHTHTSAEHMVLTKGELRVRYEGEAPVVLKPGMFAYGPANLAHEATCTSGPCVLFISFDSPIDAHPATMSPAAVKKK